jgi:hypothetical protein
MAVLPRGNARAARSGSSRGSSCGGTAVWLREPAGPADWDAITRAATGRLVRGHEAKVVVLRSPRAWSEAAIDECGEAVEQALQPELEQVLQIEIVIGGSEAFEDGEASRLHD